MNSVKELFPYFKFLKVPHTGNYGVFKNNYYGDNEPEKVNRLNIMLSKFMIRRTHVDQMFGAPLLKLPKPSEHTHWVEFNEVERQVYEVVRHRMIECINEIARKRELTKKYTNIFTMM